MNTKKYRWVLYLITLTVIATISVQVYWNYKNYLQNKQRVLNEIQLSLDNSLEEYFADLAKNDVFTSIKTQLDSTGINGHSHDVYKTKVFKNNLIDTSQIRKHKVGDVLKNVELNFKTKTFQQGKDSIISLTQDLSDINSTIGKAKGISGIKVIQRNIFPDRIEILNNLKSIYISISRDTLEYEKIDSLLQKQLLNKKLNVDYSLLFIKDDSLVFDSKTPNTQFKWSPSNFDIAKGNNIKFNWNSLSSKSTYLRSNEQFKVIYQDTSLEALKRSSFGILLSLLLSLSIISCLFYLLKVINKQKELAEIKNDLISNITHEFKTPITTVSTALEAIETFNAIDDKEKTKKYLSISSLQLKKLHQMVEKLLETATLDSEKLLLKREEIDIVELVKNVSLKNELSLDQKNISFNSFKEQFTVNIDPFHFENAISNLIDNAIKYGGNKIELHLNLVLNNLEITIADNGNSIDKSQRDKIFDKFYRIPKGNTHDVKGFGIGLYYAKKIIEKHDGGIHLVPSSTNTIFKITLPI